MSAWNNIFGNKRVEAPAEMRPDMPVAADSTVETPAEVNDDAASNHEVATGICGGCGDTPIEVIAVSGGVSHTEKRKVVYEEKLVCENESVIQQTDKIIKETDRIINALRQSIKNQEAIYDVLQGQMLRQEEENRRLSEIVKKQHETIARFQKDTLYYSQKDVIFEIIKIADEVEAIKEIGKRGGNLQEQLEGLSEFIDAGLTFSAVKSYRDADGISREFNPRRQELSSECVLTHDPGKDGAVLSLRPGYIWRLPWLVANTDIQLGNFIKANMGNQTYEVVIRPEKVARMKYEISGEAPDSICE